MEFPKIKIKNKTEKVIEYQIIPTTNRLTFDIVWQHPETMYLFVLFKKFG